jgi:hypothetical protein
VRPERPQPGQGQLVIGNALVSCHAGTPETGTVRAVAPPSMPCLHGGVGQQPGAEAREAARLELSARWTAS